MKLYYFYGDFKRYSTHIRPGYLGEILIQFKPVRNQGKKLIAWLLTGLRRNGQAQHF